MEVNKGNLSEKVDHEEHVSENALTKLVPPMSKLCSRML
jgi:hypothetical protein